MTSIGGEVGVTAKPTTSSNNPTAPQMTQGNAAVTRPHPDRREDDDELQGNADAHDELSSLPPQRRRSRLPPAEVAPLRRPGRRARAGITRFAD